MTSDFDQERCTCIKSVVQKMGLGRQYPAGLARVGGYGAPKRFAHQDGESWLQQMRRCAEAFRDTARAAMGDWAPFEALLDTVATEGISFIHDSELMLLVPALAPFNLMSGGDTELSWAAMLVQPLLLGVGESSTNFATFSSSTGPSARRMQQLLRTLGRVPFIFAAADNAAVDLVRQLGDQSLFYRNMWHCGCAKDVAPDHPPPDHPPPIEPPPIEPPWDVLDNDPEAVRCPTCRDRLERLHRFLALPVDLLLAAVQHAHGKKKKSPLCVGLAVGRKGAVRLDGLAARHPAMKRMEMVHPGVLNHTMTDAEILAVLEGWAARSNSLNELFDTNDKKARRNPTEAITIYLQLRKRLLIPFIEAWADEQLRAGGAKGLSVEEARARLDATNRLAASLERHCAELDAFIAKHTGSEGK